jgi:hypothetical protein
MTETIRLELMLRETVHAAYTNLVTRSTGRAIRSSIRERLSGGQVLALLDFSEIGLVDMSCADEVIAQLLLDPPTGTFFVLQGLSEEQLEAIEHVLAHHDLAALVHDPRTGEARPVGRVSGELRVAFECLRTGGPTTPRSLAEQTGWDETAADAVLASMARLRLVRCDGGAYSLPLSA